MRIRTFAAAAAIAVALPLTAACGTSGGSTTGSTDACEKEMHRLFDEHKADPDKPEVTETPAACEGFTDAELKDMASKIVKKELGDALGDATDEAGDTNSAATDLKVGQAYTYEDGVKITVDGVNKLTQFGEYDDQPDADETAFRLDLTIDNGSKKPLTLDDFALNAQGATNGGDVSFIYVEAGAKEMTGRVAAGVKTAKTADYALKDKYGKSVVVTVTRMSEDADVMTDDPNWTGPIR